MNPEHLKEQQEALEAATEELALRNHELRSRHWNGWLPALALSAAVIVPAWLYNADHQQGREASINTEIQALQLSNVKHQDQIGSVLDDLARHDNRTEKLEDQQQAQAGQIAAVLGDLRDQKTRDAQLEQQVRELILGRADDKKELEQLKIENKVLQEQVAANDNAQAKQAELIRELQRTKEDKSKETPRKRRFLGIFQSK